jgi:ABC-type phosphate transport system permease subunit
MNLQIELDDEQAWALAFVLISFVLITSLTARFMLERSRRKLGAR